MCHQSVGLLQGAIEAAGISTISVSVRPEVTVNMNVPRAVYVRFPTGNPVGEPHKAHQQRTILRGVLAALTALQTPGTVLELPFRWKRLRDEDVQTQRARPADNGGPCPADGLSPESAAKPVTVTPDAPARHEAAAPVAAATDGDLFAVAQRHTAAIQAAYGGLVDAVERYRAWLQVETAAAQAHVAADPAKVQALAPQLKYVAELLAALEGPTHDGLVRVSDRAVRIRHWQEGVFL